MRHPDNPREAELFDAIFADRDRAVQAVRYRLKVGGRPLVPSFVSASRDGGAPAVVLDAALPTPLPRRFKRRPVFVDLSVEGVLWHDYRGTLHLLGENEDGSGTLGAATAGFYQGGDEAATKFGKRTEYNMSRERALSDMLRRFPYDRISVPPLPGRFVRQGADAFQMVVPVGEGVEAVATEAGIEQFDTPLNEARVAPLTTISSIVGSGPLPRLRVGREVSGFSANSRSQAEFSDVDVVAVDPAGNYVSVLKNPIEVRYPPGVTPPPPGSTHYEEVREGEDVDEARARGAALARSFGFGGEWEGSITLPYIDPRIEDFDEYEVRRRNYETRAEEIFRCRIVAQSRDYVEGSMTLAWAGAMAWQEPVRPRAVVVPERAGGAA